MGSQAYDHSGLAGAGAYSPYPPQLPASSAVHSWLGPQPTPDELAQFYPDAPVVGFFDGSGRYQAGRGELWERLALQQRDTQRPAALRSPPPWEWLRQRYPGVHDVAVTVAGAPQPGLLDLWAQEMAVRLAAEQEAAYAAVQAQAERTGRWPTPAEFDRLVPHLEDSQRAAYAAFLAEWRRQRAVGMAQIGLAYAGMGALKTLGWAWDVDGKRAARRAAAAASRRQEEYDHLRREQTQYYERANRRAWRRGW